jgi:hypothetical protein
MEGKTLQPDYTAPVKRARTPGARDRLWLIARAQSAQMVQRSVVALVYWCGV